MHGEQYPRSRATSGPVLRGLSDGASDVGDYHRDRRSARRFEVGAA